MSVSLRPRWAVYITELDGIRKHFSSQNTKQGWHQTTSPIVNPGEVHPVVEAELVILVIKKCWAEKQVHVYGSFDPHIPVAHGNWRHPVVRYRIANHLHTYQFIPPHTEGFMNLNVFRVCTISCFPCAHTLSLRNPCRVYKWGPRTRETKRCSVKGVTDCTWTPWQQNPMTPSALTGPLHWNKSEINCRGLAAVDRTTFNLALAEAPRMNRSETCGDCCCCYCCHCCC